MVVDERLSPPVENGQPVIVRGRRWTIFAVERGADCRAVSLLADKPGPFRFRTLLAPFDRFQPLTRGMARVVSPSTWLKAARHHLAALSPLGGLTTAGSSGVRLLPWQLEPVLAVWRHGATRVLIADAVGLGKTVQAGLVISEICAHSVMARILVLAPAGLREQWIEELMRHFRLEALGADAGWLTRVVQERPASFNPWSAPGIYVASHDFVKRPEVLRPLEEVAWDLVVVDEAHAAALHTDRRAAADALARRSRRVVLLTATPHADDPAQFDALCRIGELGDHEPSMLVFRRTRQSLGAGLRRRSRLHLVQPSAAERRLHDLLDRYTRQIWRESASRGDEAAKLVTIVLRKRALSSAGSLLSSIRRRAEMLLDRGRLDEAQRRLPLAPLIDEDPLNDADDGAVLGTPGMSDSRREQRWLGALAEAARQAARAETKFRYLVRLLGRVKEPAIVFTEYRDTLQSLERACAAQRIRTVSLHGGLSLAERSRIRRLFNDTPCTLLATDAAAEGLNLHARCRFIVHYELPWSLARLEQRTGRVDRLGQTRRVHEIGLVADDTSERLVLAPLAARAARAQDTAAFAEGLATVFTESRVAALIMMERRDTWTPPRPLDTGPFNRSRPLPTSPPRHSLADEAAEEAHRLLDLRELMKCIGNHTQSHHGQTVATSITNGRASLSPGLYAVFLIVVTARDGRTISVQSCVVSHPLQSALARIKPSALRAIATRLFRFTDARTVEALSAASAAAADASANHLAVVTRGLAHRERLLRHSRTGASRQLVQAGLFDGRAAREAARQTDLHRAFAEESENRLDTLAHAPIVSVDVRLAAVLHVAPAPR